LLLPVESIAKNKLQDECNETAQISVANDHINGSMPDTQGCQAKYLTGMQRSGWVIASSIQNLPASLPELKRLVTTRYCDSALI
jgi:hypothetical protein